MKRIIGRQCRVKPREVSPVDAVAANDAPIVEERVVLPSGFEAIVVKPRFHPDQLGRISQKEAAVYLGMCEKRLRERIRDGLPHPPFTVREGRRWFAMDALHAWLRADGTENDGIERNLADAA